MACDRQHFSWKLIPCSLIIVLSLVSYVMSNQVRIKEREILDKILDPSNYDKRIRAFGANGSDPTVINVNLYVRSIDTIDEKKMEYSVQLTFRMQWFDGRLQYANQGYSVHGISYLTLTELSQIWIPDLFFSNEKEAYAHEMLMKNTYARIFPDGQVLVSQRLTLKLSCPMDLKLYPMDKQICSMRMASYGWTTTDLIFQWKPVDPVQVTNNLYLPRFHLENFVTDHCDSTTNTGTYSCLRLDFYFGRELSFYLVQIYIPCLMLCIIAWLSFWINSKQVVGRIIVTLVTLLVMATQVTEFNSTLMPATSYTKAIDVWTGFCLTFVFAAFVEFVVVHYLTSCEEKEDKNSGNQPNSTDGLPETKASGKQNKKSVIEAFKSSSISGKIDLAARIVYPILFIFFNIIYWAANL